MLAWDAENVRSYENLTNFACLRQIYLSILIEGRTVEQPGVMLYEYKKSDAQIIKNALATLFGTDILLINGSCRESDVIENIISDTTYNKFEDQELKVLMFLGFANNQINLALNNSPGADKVTRPIFCTFTQNNITQVLNQLLQHLVEEKND